MMLYLGLLSEGLCHSWLGELAAADVCATYVRFLVLLHALGCALSLCHICAFVGLGGVAVAISEQTDHKTYWFVLWSVCSEMMTPWLSG